MFMFLMLIGWQVGAKKYFFRRFPVMYGYNLKISWIFQFSYKINLKSFSVIICRICWEPEYCFWSLDRNRDKMADDENLRKARGASNSSSFDKHELVWLLRIPIILHPTFTGDVGGDEWLWFLKCNEGGQNA